MKYCSLAFNSVSFGPWGGSRPCCAIDVHFWRNDSHVLERDYNNDVIKWFNNPDIVKLRQDLLDDKWHPACNMCKAREDAGQPSHRMIFNRAMDQVQTELNKDLHEDTAIINNLDKVFYLDVTVGNKCNSACVMCNPSASTLWQQEQEAINNMKFTLPSSVWFNKERAIDLINRIPNLSAINFLGGEPTINDDHVVMLKELIRQGRSKRISINYVTNLTGVSDELLELWSHFGTKHLTISVDGIGKVNEYIRYPFSWDKVTRQIGIIKQIADSKNYNVFLSHTVTGLNILKLDEVMDWWEGEVSSHPAFNKSLPHIQCVHQPVKFDPSYVPREMKKDIGDTLVRLQDVAKKHNVGDKYDSVIEYIKRNVIDVNHEEKLRMARWMEMQEFLTKLDVYRKRKIFDYLPYMEKYWVK